jgi:hypothetical protein
MPPEKVPAALAIADRLRDDLGRDAARGEALAVVVNRIELSPIRLRVILSAAALMPANPDATDHTEALASRGDGSGGNPVGGFESAELGRRTV